MAAGRRTERRKAPIADGGGLMTERRQTPFVVELDAGYKKFWFIVERMLSVFDKTIEK